MTRFVFLLYFSLLSFGPLYSTRRDFVRFFLETLHWRAFDRTLERLFKSFQTGQTKLSLALEISQSKRGMPSYWQTGFKYSGFNTVDWQFNLQNGTYELRFTGWNDTNGDLQTGSYERRLEDLEPTICKPAPSARLAKDLEKCLPSRPENIVHCDRSEERLKRKLIWRKLANTLKTKAKPILLSPDCNGGAFRLLLGN